MCDDIEMQLSNFYYSGCACRIYDLLGYRSDDLIGQSVYEYYHALDSDEMDKAYKNRTYTHDIITVDLVMMLSDSAEIKTFKIEHFLSFHA